jgi:hypothetical protein
MVSLPIFYHLAFLSIFQMSTAFEKKTDISTAISIAQRKKLPLLVSELETKMSAVANVTHTDVKKLKEIHLVSKSLKNEISALATRRFLRLRETSTERVIGLLTVWAQNEEDAASAEIKALGEVIAEVERQFENVDFSSDGISHTFFGRSLRKRRPSV